MPRVLEEELVCITCGRITELPECHGKTMEFDGSVFFCPTCQREIKTPVCCDQPMQVRRKVRNLRKDLFRLP